MPGLDKHFLLKSFTDYYQELADARSAIVQGRLAEYLKLPAQDEMPSNELLVSLLFKKLQSALSLQHQQIRNQATDAEQQDYARLLYVLAVLTDEQLLLDSGWDQAHLWQKELLETSIFATQQAGTRFYDYLEELLNDRSSVSNRADLAAVFLMGLSLGFRGRYRSRSGEKQIQRFRARLYKLLKTKPSSGYLFTQAYQHALRETEDPARHRISALSRWYKYAAIGFCFYLLLSSAVWLANSMSLSKSMNALDCGTSCAPSSTAVASVSTEDKR